MKKILLSVITIMLLLSVVMPVTVQAATLSANRIEMKVNDVVEVTVKTKKDVENIQFDLQFDNTKYEYVNDSARSELDSTASNLMSENVVRVSAFNLNKTKTDTVTLLFKAIGTGKDVPFSIVGTPEIGENGEQFENAEIIVNKINAVSKITVSQYYDEFGNPIARHPQTGEEIQAKETKSIGTYKELVNNELVVPYALQNSDSLVTVDSIKAEFGEITTTLTNPVKTGDKFTIDGKEHTAIIYGDVNSDGKVTTADALEIRRNELGTTKTKFDSFQAEAADVENNELITEKDALAVQKFVLGLRVTNTDTILDRYPKTEEPEKLIEGITKLTGASTGTHYVYDKDIVIATIASNNDVKLTEDVLDFIVEEAPEGADTANAVQYVDLGSGIFEARLYATESGTYKVTLVVKGANVKDSKIEMTQDDITVDEYYEVENMKIFNSQNEDVTNNLIAREGKSIERKVRFYHKYTDKDGKDVDKDITSKVKVANISMTKTTNHISADYTNLYNKNNETIVFAADGSYVSGLDTVDYISIQGTTEGSDIITIKVQNEDGTTFKKEITVTVKTRAKVKSVIFNGVELSTEEPGNVTLYTSNPGLNTVDEVVNASNASDIKYYTIVPISIRDEDGDVEKLVHSTLSKMSLDIKDNNTVLLENATMGDGTRPNASSDIALLRKYILNENNEYKLESTTTQKIDAVGIALNKPTDKTCIENVKQGITIDYDGITGRERVEVNVTIVDTNTIVNDEENEADETTTPDEITTPDETKQTENDVTPEQQEPLKSEPILKQPTNGVVTNTIVNDVTENPSVNDTIESTGKDETTANNAETEEPKVEEERSFETTTIDSISQESEPEIQ